MNHSIRRIVYVATLAMTTEFSFAIDQDSAEIKKDRWQIEGTWQISALDVNGSKADDDDVKKLKVINNLDGSWSLRSEGNEISRGTTTIDPSRTPKTIDISPSDGSGDTWLGIYELSANTRKLCFAKPGKPRPTEFKTVANDDQVLVVFNRDLSEATNLDRKRIEGVWQLRELEADGNKSVDEEKKLTVVFGIDGSWSLNLDGREVAQGTSSISLELSPRTIDFTQTTGEEKGKQTIGIYEVSESELKFCVVPAGQTRPTDYSAAVSSQRILITFDRSKPK